MVKLIDIMIDEKRKLTRLRTAEEWIGRYRESVTVARYPGKAINS